jgi:hypothetical protein
MKASESVWDGWACMRVMFVRADALSDMKWVLVMLGWPRLGTFLLREAVRMERALRLPYWPSCEACDVSSRKLLARGDASVAQVPSFMRMSSPSARIHAAHNVIQASQGNVRPSLQSPYDVAVGWR